MMEPCLKDYTVTVSRYPADDQLYYVGLNGMREWVRSEKVYRQNVNIEIITNAMLSIDQLIELLQAEKHRIEQR